MNHYTVKEIEDFIIATWTTHDKWGDHRNVDDVKVIKNKPDYVEIKLENMYDPPGLGFAKLKAVSDFFDTTNIDDPVTFSMGGCETCDYGSSYGFTLVMRPNKEKA